MVSFLITMAIIFLLPYVLRIILETICLILSSKKDIIGCTLDTLIFCGIILIIWAVNTIVL